MWPFMNNTAVIVSLEPERRPGVPFSSDCVAFGTVVVDRLSRCGAACESKISCVGRVDI